MVTLNQFNDKNPFVVILKQRDLYLNSIIVNIIGNFIIMSILNIVCIGVSFFLGGAQSIVFDVYATLNLCLTGFMIYHMVSSRERKQLDDILTDEIKNIVSTNNERVLSLIEKYDEYIGGVKKLQEKMYLDMIISVILIIVVALISLTT